MVSLLPKLNVVAQFPSYPGPYAVGTADFEVDTSIFTSTTSNESPLPPSHSSDISTFQFRVFYPTALKGEPASTSTTKHNNGHSLPTAVKWLPSPRREYLAAYIKFMGLRPLWASLFTSIPLVPRMFYHIDMPVFSGHSLMKAASGEGGGGVPEKLPTVIFSHGLGGTRNVYSYLCGSIASQGCVVFALEHRDGSAPASFIRPSARHREHIAKIRAEGVPETPSSASSTDDETEKQASASAVKDKLSNLKLSDIPESKRIDYVKHPHEITDSTAALRNKQFEIRFWELGLMFAFVQRLTSSHGFDPSTEVPHMRIDPFKNKLSSLAAEFLSQFQNRLNVHSPGSIIWMGHSFGAATIAQFVKSVWYHTKLTSSEEGGFMPLYSPSSELLSHFRPEDKSQERAPVTILLDPWTLPLLGNRTRPLWRLPLPGPTFCGLSQEFFVWRDNVRGNRHVLSVTGGGSNGLYDHGDKKHPLPSDGDEHDKEEEEEGMPELQRTDSLDARPEIPGGIVGTDADKAAAGDDNELEHTRSLLPTISREGGKNDGRPDRKFFYVKDSGHMNHSDFGVLFPRGTQAMTKAVDPEEILRLNTRAILEYMRENGHAVAPFERNCERDEKIFGPEGSVERWLAVGLDMDDEMAEFERKRAEKKKQQQGKKEKKENEVQQEVVDERVGTPSKL